MSDAPEPLPLCPSCNMVPQPSFDLHAYLSGHVMFLISQGLVSLHDARQACLAVAQNDEFWMRVPVMQEALQRALPRMQADVEVEVQQREQGRRGTA